MQAAFSSRHSGDASPTRLIQTADLEGRLASPAAFLVRSFERQFIGGEELCLANR